MRAFKRSLGRFTATFTAVEVSLLADLVDQVRELLAQRRSETPTDPLARLTGMVVGPSRPPADPALARLLPDFVRDDPELAGGLRVLREPELVAQKDSAAVRLLDSLPRGGGTVHLDEQTANSWIATINDVRLALGVRLDITQEPLDEEMATQDTPHGHALQAYAWLSYVQDSLVSAMLD